MTEPMRPASSFKKTEAFEKDANDPKVIINPSHRPRDWRPQQPSQRPPLFF
ncbi:MAG: hypothetical protein K2Q01_06840 [Rickettsiales bacterium]|nr:hypothetical protein [Rickettsiales bacterium]